MTLYLIVLITFLTHIGFAGSRVAVALFAVDRGATPFIVGTVVALYAALPAVLALPVGRITDRLGMRIPLLFGTCGVFVALTLPYLWPALPTLYFTASLLGISFMAFQLAAQTLTGAIAAPAKRAHNFALVSLGFASANFTGPLLAGILIDHIGHARTFLMLAMPLIPAIAVTAAGRRWIPDVHGKSHVRSGGVLELLRIRTLRDTLIASGIISSAWDLYQFFMPIYGRAQGLSATSIGSVLSAFAIAIILVRIVLPFALRRVGEAQLLTYAMFVACAAYCLFPLFHSAWLLAAASFLLGIGCGCGQPLSMTLVYNASPKGRAGEATGMRITVNQVTHFTIPLLFG
ncbi:MAG TPA: MFS transporter, partial [Burkholderiales bacterium]|nr:MFS transporter [Burkholderiales bacterium]